MKNRLSDKELKQRINIEEALKNYEFVHIGEELLASRKAIKVLRKGLESARRTFALIEKVNRLQQWLKSKSFWR